MPIDVVRFGVGHRRPQGPAGTVSIEGQVIHSDARGVIAELAFGRGGLIAPHSNPNLTWFVVIEGGGWVQVGPERIRVQAGDAVVWPPDVDHGAWTEHSSMRALVVEFASGAAHVAGVIEGTPRPSLGPGPAVRAQGGLRPRRMQRATPAGNPEGEPA